MLQTARLGVLMACLPGCHLVFGVDGGADAGRLDDCAGDEVAVDVDVIRLRSDGDGRHLTTAEVVPWQHEVSIDGAAFVRVEPDAGTGDLRFCRDRAGAPYRLRSRLDGAPLVGEVHAASTQLRIGRVLFGRADAALEGPAPAALTINVQAEAAPRSYALRTSGVYGAGQGQTLAANQASISVNWDQLVQPTWPRRAFDASAGDRLYYLHYENAVLTRIGDISAVFDGGVEVDPSSLPALPGINILNLPATVFDYARWLAALPVTAGDAVAVGTTIAAVPESGRTLSPSYPLTFSLSASAPTSLTFANATALDPALDTVLQSAVSRTRTVDVSGHALQLGAQFFAFAHVDALPTTTFVIPEFPAVSFTAVNLAAIPELGLAAGLDPSVDQPLAVSGFQGGSGRTLMIQVMEIVYPERPGGVALLTPVFIVTYGEHPGPLVVPAGTMQPGRRYVLRTAHRAGADSDTTGDWISLTYPLSQMLVDSLAFEVPET